MSFASPPRANAALEFIARGEASASAFLDFTGFDASRYCGYSFQLDALKPATTSNFLVQLSQDGGATFKAGASDYTRMQKAGFSNSNLGYNGGTGNGIYAAAMLSTGVGVSGWFHLPGPDGSGVTIGHGNTIDFMSAYSGVYSATGWGGVLTLTGAVDAIRFLYASGNIASGSVSMFAVKKTA